MAEVISILSTCWTLINTINGIVGQLEQTREHTRAFAFLHKKAETFVRLVNDGLTGRDTTPYAETISSLEILLRDILKEANGYSKMSIITQMMKASQIKQSILLLDERLRLFVDSYLIQTTTTAASVQLNAIPANPSPLHERHSEGEDDAQQDVDKHERAWRSMTSARNFSNSPSANRAMESTGEHVIGNPSLPAIPTSPDAASSTGQHSRRGHPVLSPMTALYSERSRADTFYQNGSADGAYRERGILPTLPINSYPVSQHIITKTDNDCEYCSYNTATVFLVPCGHGVCDDCSTATACPTCYTRVDDLRPVQ